MIYVLFKQLFMVKNLVDMLSFFSKTAMYFSLFIQIEKKN
jgi:hypothetical protein